MRDDATKKFRLLLAVYGLSTLADAGISMFLAWVTLEHRGAAAMSGVFIGSAAACLFGPAVGKALDVAPARLVLGSAHLARLVVLCVLAAMTPATIARYAPAVAFLCTFFNLAHGPTVSKSIPVLFPKEEMRGANSASGSLFLIASAGGPALGGALLENYGPRSVIAFFAAALLLGIPFAWSYRPAEAVKAVVTDGSADTNGFRAIMTMPLVLLLVTLGVGLNFALAPVNVALAPLMRSLGSGPQAFGFAMGLFIVGALAGNAVAGGRFASLWTWEQSISASLAAIAAAFLALVASGSPLQAAASIFLIGVALPFIQIPLAVQLQKTVPTESAGQVFSTVSSITLLAAPVAAALTGVLLKRFQPAQIFLGASVLCTILWAGWTLASRAVPSGRSVQEQ